jgi:hypothetical protein
MEFNFVRVLITTLLILASLSVSGILSAAGPCDSMRPAGASAFKPLDVTASGTPYFQVCTHWPSNMLLSVSNFGCVGSFTGNYDDCERQIPAPSMEYPAGSGANYLELSAIWIGALVDEDTVVSTGFGWRESPGG